MPLEIIGDIAQVETIAQGSGIRDLALAEPARPRQLAQEEGDCPREAAGWRNGKGRGSLV